jgi:hypothetical protein
MDTISESLRRATDAPPPTRISIDGIIAGERRRRRFLIGGSTITSVAAASVAVVLLGQGLTGPGIAGPAPGVPTGCVAPTPSMTKAPSKAPIDPSAVPPMHTVDTGGPSPMVVQDSPEPVDAAKHRIGSAFAAALHSAMPGVPFQDWADPACPLPQVSTYDAAFPYESAVIVNDAEGRGVISVHLYPVASWRPPCDDCAWHQDLPDGGLAFGVNDTPGRVDVWRPDGTGMMLLATEYAGDPLRANPPATRQQLIAIGDYPALSMYPR